MPKPITEYEREQIKKSIIKHTHQLILDRKGIKTITVDDIIRTAVMGKSTFYSIYKSKEACFCDVIENEFITSLEKADLLRQQEMTSEERTVRFFREVYLAKNSIGNYVTEVDIESIFRKLPPEYNEKKQMLMGGGIIKYVIEELGYNETQAETLNLLLSYVDNVFTSNYGSERAKEEAIDCLIQMLVEFFKKNKNIEK